MGKEFLSRMDSLQSFQAYVFLEREVHTAKITEEMTTHRSKLESSGYRISKTKGALYLILDGWNVAKTTPKRGVITL